MINRLGRHCDSISFNSGQLTRVILGILTFSIRKRFGVIRFTWWHFENLLRPGSPSVRRSIVESTRLFTEFSFLYLRERLSLYVLPGGNFEDLVCPGSHSYVVRLRAFSLILLIVLRRISFFFRRYFYAPPLSESACLFAEFSFFV